MSDNDYNKQYERRQRIRKTTLVMGIDIGADFNAIGFMNKDGSVLSQLPKVDNSREGFDKFIRATEDLKEKHGFKDVLIGLEPSFLAASLHFVGESSFINMIRTSSRTIFGKKHKSGHVS